MQKTKTVRTYKRKTKSGKTVTVKQHTAKYDAAEAARKAFLKDSRAGSEYASIKDMPMHGISADDFKEWYHWDLDDDPNNEAALRVKEALVKKLGKKGYQDYEDKMTDSYTRRGHLSAFKKLEGMLKPKPNTTYEHTTKLPRKHSAERPLSDRGAKNLEGIQGKGLKMPKGFKYNDEQHSDDYDSFVATDKRAINALKKQIAGKRWKKVEAEDGSVHFHSPDKSVHVVVNDQRAAIFYRENPVTAKPKKEVAQVAPKGSSKTGTNEHFEEYLVKHYKSKSNGDDNLDQIHKDYSKKYGAVPQGATDLGEIRRRQKETKKSPKRETKKSREQEIQEMNDLVYRGITQKGTAKKKEKPKNSAGETLRRVAIGKGVYYVDSKKRVYEDVTKKDGTTAWKYDSQGTKVYREELKRRSESSKRRPSRVKLPETK